MWQESCHIFQNSTILKDDNVNIYWIPTNSQNVTISSDVNIYCFSTSDQLISYLLLLKSHILYCQKCCNIVMWWYCNVVIYTTLYIILLMITIVLRKATIAYWPLVLVDCIPGGKYIQSERKLLIFCFKNSPRPKNLMTIQV